MEEKTISESDVISALSQVMDPELGRDLVSLGMIEDIHIEGSRVSFTLVLTTPACPLRKQIKEAAQAAVSRLPGVKEVEVKVSSRLVPSMYAREELIPEVGHTIAVASGKGGVGKSTVAVNLAVALAESGARVGLLDADIYGPNIPLLMGAKELPRSQGPKIEPLVRYGVRLISMGFFVRLEEAVIWRGPLVASAIKQLLGDVEWGKLDYLIIDLPPGTGDAQLTLAQSIPLTGAVIVTTPQDVALADAVKAVNMFRKLDVAVFGLVENMSYFLCPHCGNRTEIFGHGGGKRASLKHGVAFLGEIPLDVAIRSFGDQGLPIVVADPNSAQAKAFRHIAEAVASQISIFSLASQSR